MRESPAQGGRLVRIARPREEVSLPLPWPAYVGSNHTRPRQLSAPSTDSKSATHEYLSFSCRLPFIHVADDHLLKAAGVEPGSIAGVFSWYPGR